jgi:hypothetical protein
MTLLQNFQPAVYPGLLQTPEYARRVITLLGVADADDVAAAVAARMNRQAILYKPEKSFEFVLSEAALRWRPGPAALLLAQLDRLLAVASLPNITIGVLPLSSEASVLHTNGYTIFHVPDDPFVLVETLTEERFLRGEDHLPTYKRVFAATYASALSGLEAVQFIEALRAEFLGT